jgi:hypothetical protein
MLQATSIAVQAETLRLRLLARRTVARAILGLVALIFLLSALTLAHVAVWYWLRIRFDWPMDGTAAVLTAGDIVLAGVLALVASRLGPGQVEMEARLVRQQALRSLTSAAVWSTLLVRLVEMLRRR